MVMTQPQIWALVFFAVVIAIVAVMLIQSQEEGGIR